MLASVGLRCRSYFLSKASIVSCFLSSPSIVICHSCCPQNFYACYFPLLVSSRQDQHGTYRHDMHGTHRHDQHAWHSQVLCFAVYLQREKQIAWFQTTGGCWWYLRCFLSFTSFIHSDSNTGNMLLIGGCWWCLKCFRSFISFILQRKQDTHRQLLMVPTVLSQFNILYLFLFKY